MSDIQNVKWFKIITKPFFPEGKIKALSEEEAIKMAIKEWHISPDIIVKAMPLCIPDMND